MCTVGFALDSRELTMNRKVKWGILSTAKIGKELVVPAMQHSRFSEISGIASRDLSSAKSTAEALGIEAYYDSYNELLAAPEIDAVYIPLPNHMHTEWAIKAMNAKKHVLCEKPLALSIDDVKKLIETRNQNGVKAGEAFMVNSHPQWRRIRELIQEGALGRIRAIQGFFCYMNKDPANIRNKPQYGGGVLWDIGCYLMHCSRYLLEREPARVVASLTLDPVFQTDSLASAILDFDDVLASFTISTQLADSQKMTIYGEKTKLEIEIPFNAPIDREVSVFLGREPLMQQAGERIRFPAANQYTLQGDEFSKAIIENTDVPVPFEDSLNNTASILAAFESARTGKAVNPADLI
jgi:predicted dehydrogenase